MPDVQRLKRRGGRITAATLAAGLLMSGFACTSETEFDPEQERNVRPGQRPEGSPRDEEA